VKSGRKRNVGRNEEGGGRPNLPDDPRNKAM